MRKIRSFGIAIIIMILTSLLALFVVSTLTYFLKWYADKAMAGIIVTYILAGFAGGMTLKILNKEKMGLRGRGLEVFCLSGIFMLLLFVVSIFVLRNPFEISGRWLMIWLLLTSSTFLGRIL
ncbi:MAG: hypothetical protein IJA07_08540 [Agathobacter sp.]|nr:hypothetical protein [Agathobacter sp.]